MLTIAQIEMKIDGLVHRPLQEGAMLGVSLVAAWPADPDDAGKARLARRFVTASRQVLQLKKSTAAHAEN